MRPTIKPYFWKIILIFIRNFDIFSSSWHPHLFWVRMRLRMWDLVRMRMSVASLVNNTICKHHLTFIRGVLYHPRARHIYFLTCGVYFLTANYWKLISCFMVDFFLILIVPYLKFLSIHYRLMKKFKTTYKINLFIVNICVLIPAFTAFV